MTYEDDTAKALAAANGWTPGAIGLSHEASASAPATSHAGSFEAATADDFARANGRTPGAIGMAHETSARHQRIIDRSAKDSEKLADVLKCHSVEDFALAAAVLGAESGTHLLTRFANDERKLVPKLVSLIDELKGRMAAIETTIIPIIEARSGSKAASLIVAYDDECRQFVLTEAEIEAIRAITSRQPGVPVDRSKAMSIVDWVDERSEHYELSDSASAQLRAEMRQRAKALSLATQADSAAVEKRIDRLIESGLEIAV